MRKSRARNPGGWYVVLVRRMISRFLVVLVLAASSLEGWTEEMPITGYSTAPIHSPLFDEAQVVVEAVRINNWLNDNLQSLPPEDVKWPREHLFYLIDSRVKQIYAEQGHVLPLEHDLVLELLFSWAEPLGVHGGSEIFNVIKAPSTPARVSESKLPEGISLALDKDLLRLKSSLGWEVTFPYYFMFFDAKDFVAKNGPRTQLFIISTGATRDVSPAGKSQATLMFLFTPEEHEPFDRYWATMFGIGPETPAKALGVRKLSSRHAFDVSTKLHKEFTSWSGPAGAYAVAYMGIEGTFEWNRQHFIDFLGAVVDSPASRPNKLQQRTDPAFTPFSAGRSGVHATIR